MQYFLRCCPNIFVEHALQGVTLKLRRMVMAAQEPYVETTTEHTQLLPVLLRILQHHLGDVPRPDQYDADLTELGVDSLMAIEIAHRLEEELGIVINDREALGFRSVNAIYSTLRRYTLDVPAPKPGTLR